MQKVKQTLKSYEPEILMVVTAAIMIFAIIMDIDN